MSRYLRIALILSALWAASLGLFLILLNTSSESLLFGGVVVIALFLLSVSFFAISIGARLHKRVSPYRIFAVVNSCFGVCVAGYAIYDIKTDVGWLAGIFGAVLLIFVIPIVVVLLILDFIVWACNRRR